MLKIRRPLGRLIFNMGIVIPGKTVFLIETAPWSLVLRMYKYQILYTSHNNNVSKWFSVTICRMNLLCTYHVFFGNKRTAHIYSISNSKTSWHLRWAYILCVITSFEKSVLRGIPFTYAIISWHIFIMDQRNRKSVTRRTQIVRFMWPTWDPPGADRTQMGPMLAPWTLLSGNPFGFDVLNFCSKLNWVRMHTKHPRRIRNGKHFDFIHTWKSALSIWNLIKIMIVHTTIVLHNFIASC